MKFHCGNGYGDLTQRSDLSRGQSFQTKREYRRKDDRKYYTDSWGETVEGMMEVLEDFYGSNIAYRLGSGEIVRFWKHRL